jgi:phosphoribosylanthranilate isomerase
MPYAVGVSSGMQNEVRKKDMVKVKKLVNTAKPVNKQ